MANVGPSAWYCRDNAPTSTIGWSAVAAWTNHTTAAGELRRQSATPTVGNERVFAALNAAATGGSEPSWTVTKGAKTTDGSVTWLEVTGQPGVNGDIPVSKTTNASTASGSAVLSFASTSGILVGMYAGHANLPTGSSSATVLSFSSTTVVLSGNATGTIASGQAVWFGFCPTWLNQKNTAVSQGHIIFDTVTASLQACTTAGTPGNSSNPSFSTTAGTTTADNTATWTSLGLASNFAAWTAPHAKLQNALTSTWAAAGNDVFVGDDHNQTQASAIAGTASGTEVLHVKVWCVDHTVSLPAGTSNLKSDPYTTSSPACAQITTTGANGQVYSTFLDFYGIVFNVGSGATNVTLNFGGMRGNITRCSFRKLGTTANTGAIALPDGDCIDCSVQIGATGDSIQNGSPFQTRWMNGTSGAVIGATLPTTLAIPNSGSFQLIGLDLSAFGSGKTIFGANAISVNALVLNCTLGSSVTIAATPTGRKTRIQLIVSDSTGINYRQEEYWLEGTLVTETVLVRTGGATDGTTSISWKLATTANSTWLYPLETFSEPIWNSTTGSSRTVTIYGIANVATMPNNDDWWIEESYLGSSSSPIASLGTSGKANYLASGSSLTADTSAWDSLLTARANSTAYNVGDIRKVSSNSGRAFFCITAGTSSGSLPGGYATAVDGDSVTDGTAVFRAAYRFRAAVAVTPQLVGPIRPLMRMAKPSTTLYVDPTPVLS